MHRCTRFTQPLGPLLHKHMFASEGTLYPLKKQSTVYFQSESEDALWKSSQIPKIEICHLDTLRLTMMEV